MRKLIVLLSLFVLLVALMPAAPAAAGDRVEVSGTTSYTPHLVGIPRVAGGNTFLTTTEDAEWVGSFVGTSFDECKVIVHRSGMWTYTATAYFHGSVEGQEGELIMRMNGRRPDGDADWTGNWVILRGSEDLANLRGEGTFAGPGAEDFEVSGSIEYEGHIHFDPAH